MFVSEQLGKNRDRDPSDKNWSLKIKTVQPHPSPVTVTLLASRPQRTRLVRHAWPHRDLNQRRSSTKNPGNRVAGFGWTTARARVQAGRKRIGRIGCLSRTPTFLSRSWLGSLLQPQPPSPNFLSPLAVLFQSIDPYGSPLISVPAYHGFSELQRRSSSGSHTGGVTEVL